MVDKTLKILDFLNRSEKPVTIHEIANGAKVGTADNVFMPLQELALSGLVDVSRRIRCSYSHKFLTGWRITGIGMKTLVDNMDKASRV